MNERKYQIQLSAEISQVGRKIDEFSLKEKSCIRDRNLFFVEMNF